MIYIALWRVWISLNFYCMYYWMNFILSCERNTAYGQHFHLAFLFLTGYFHIVLSPRGAAVDWLTFLPFPKTSLSAKSSRSQGISPKEEEFIGFLCHISSGTWFLWSYRLQRPAFNYFLVLLNQHRWTMDARKNMSLGLNILKLLEWDQTTIFSLFSEHHH